MKIKPKKESVKKRANLRLYQTLFHFLFSRLSFRVGLVACDAEHNPTELK